MQLDRTQAPEFQLVKHIFLPDSQAYTLDNGLPLRIINAGEQPILRLELIFQAGGWFEPAAGVAHYMTRMLTEGTRSRTGAQVSAAFDQYGAFTEFFAGSDRVNLTVYCLARYLPEILPVLQELLHEASFPEQELETVKSINLQTLKVNQEKTSYVATQHFRERVFGASHPYGRRQTESLIESMNRDLLTDYYQTHFVGKPYTLFLAGRVSEREVALLNTALGQEKLAAPTYHMPSHAVRVRNHEAELIKKEDSLQSSIRLGKRLFTRHHPDYFRFVVLNEVFGGYFGSRLMKNIREDKGFTYGINSSLNCLSHDGYLTIGTDVKKENTAQTLDEIGREIHTLQSELVPASELETVKNFMIGSFAGALNTPFEIADRQKTLYFDQLPADFYQTYVEQIRAVSAEEVREMAHRYLALDSMQEIVVGGK